MMMFVDNAGADIVLGMLPFARELLRAGCEVVLVANAQPAINDITLPELLVRHLLAQLLLLLLPPQLPPRPHASAAAAAAVLLCSCGCCSFRALARLLGHLH
jgi:hypothetical protein